MPRAALQQDVSEAAGGGTDVECHLARRVDPERVERPRELVPAPTDVWLRLVDGDGGGPLDAIARLQVTPGGIALAHAHLSADDQRLCLRPCLGEPPLDDELVEALLLRLDWPLRDRRIHRAIVAQPAAPGLTFDDQTLVRLESRCVPPVHKKPVKHGPRWTPPGLPVPLWGRRHIERCSSTANRDSRSRMVLDQVKTRIRLPKTGPLDPPDHTTPASW